MADHKQHRGPRNSNGRPGRLVSAVAEPEAAEYVFELIRSLVAITRDYRDFRLTTYFLEMAAMEIARLKKSRRARPDLRAQGAPPFDRAGG